MVENCVIYTLLIKDVLIVVEDEMGCLATSESCYR